jgi:hypothetical protein
MGGEGEGEVEMSRTRWIIAGVVVLVVLGVAATGQKPTTSPAAGEGAAGASVRASAAPSAPTVLLDLKGSGIHRSKKFTAGGEWTIAYTYDCASFGQKGNFQIFVEGDASDVAANELAAKGQGTQNEFTPGTFDLSMNSECDWHVTVKG